MKPFLRFLALALLLTSCAGGEEGRGPSLLEARDFAITEVIGSDWIGNRFDFLLLIDAPVKPESALYHSRGQESSAIEKLSKLIPEVPEALLQEFLSESRVSHIKQAPSSNSIIQVVQKSQIDQEFDEAEGLPGPFWERFKEVRPKCAGIVKTSRVAYSHDLSQALIYLDWRCGGRCGTGNLVWLEFENDSWKILENRVTWIS